MRGNGEIVPISHVDSRRGMRLLLRLQDISKLFHTPALVFTTICTYTYKSLLYLYTYKSFVLNISDF